MPRTGAWSCPGDERVRIDRRYAPLGGDTVVPRLTRPSGANPSIAGVDECVRYMIGTSERGTPRRAPAVAAPAGSRDPLTARPFCDVRRHRPARRLPAA
ncbi:MAG TPA: hypothetical protein PKJ40_16360, partial [Plasticicumulans sp.]|nr:hypothetical protein [Plasticicumulans sp.]